MTDNNSGSGQANSGAALNANDDDVAATEILSPDAQAEKNPQQSDAVTGKSTEIVAEPLTEPALGTVEDEPTDAQTSSKRLHLLARYLLPASIAVLVLTVSAIALQALLKTSPELDENAGAHSAEEPYQRIPEKLQAELVAALNARDYRVAFQLSQRPAVSPAYKEDMQSLTELLLLAELGQVRVFAREIDETRLRTPEFAAHLPLLRDLALAKKERDQFAELDRLWHDGELIAVLNGARALARGAQESAPLSPKGQKYAARQLRHYQATVRAYDQLLNRPDKTAAAALALSLDPQHDRFFLTQMRADYKSLDTELARQARANVDYARRRLADYDKRWGAPGERPKKEDAMNNDTQAASQSELEQSARRQLLTDTYKKLAAAYSHGQLDDTRLLARLNRELRAFYLSDDVVAKGVANGEADGDAANVQLLEQLQMRRVPEVAAQ